MAYYYSSSDEDIYADLDDLHLNQNVWHPSSDDDCRSARTEIPTDPWLDDHDVLTTNGSEYWRNESASIFNLEESKLREEEHDLFNELMVVEAEEKKAEVEYKSGYESLQCEVEKLRKSDAEKSARISQLTSENINLKKNICSLFKTAKSEIENKDFLLKQANRKLDGLLFKRHNFYNQNVRQEAHSNLASKEASSKDGEPQNFKNYQKPLGINESATSYHRPQSGPFHSRVKDDQFPTRVRDQEHDMPESQNYNSNIKNIKQGSVISKKTHFDSKNRQFKSIRSIPKVVDNYYSSDDSTDSERQNRVLKLKSNRTKAEVSDNKTLLKENKLDSISKWVESTLNYNGSTTNAQGNNSATDLQSINPESANVSNEENKITTKRRGKPGVEDSSVEKSNEICNASKEAAADLNNNDAVVPKVSSGGEECKHSPMHQSSGALHDRVEKSELAQSSSEKTEVENVVSLVNRNSDQQNHVEYVIVSGSEDNTNLKKISYSEACFQEKNYTPESNKNVTQTKPSVENVSQILSIIEEYNITEEMLTSIENASQNISINEEGNSTEEMTTGIENASLAVSMNEEYNNTENMITGIEIISLTANDTEASAPEAKSVLQSGDKKDEQASSNEVKDNKEFNQDVKSKCANTDSVGSKKKSNSNDNETFDKNVSNNVLNELGDADVRNLLGDSASTGISVESKEGEARNEQNELVRKMNEECLKEYRDSKYSSNRDRDKSSRDEKYSNSSVSVRRDSSPQTQSSKKPRKRDCSIRKHSGIRNKEKNCSDSDSSNDNTYRRSMKDGKHRKIYSPYKRRRDYEKYSADFFDRDRSRSSKSRELIAVRKRCFRNFRSTRTTSENRQSYRHYSPKPDIRRSSTERNSRHQTSSSYKKEQCSKKEKDCSIKSSKRLSLIDSKNKFDKNPSNERSTNKNASVISSSVQNDIFTDTNTFDMSSEIVDGLSVISSEITNNAKNVVTSIDNCSKYAEYQENVQYDRKCYEIFNKIGKSISCDEPKLDFSDKVKKKMAEENSSSVTSDLCHLSDKTEHVSSVPLENNVINFSVNNCLPSDKKEKPIENRILSDGEICSSDEDCNLHDNLKSCPVKDTKINSTLPISKIRAVSEKSHCNKDQNICTENNSIDNKVRRTSSNITTKIETISTKNVHEQKIPNNENAIDNDLKNNATTGSISEKNHCERESMQTVDKTQIDDENIKRSSNEDKMIVSNTENRKHMSKSSPTRDYESDKQLYTSLKVKKLKYCKTKINSIYQKGRMKNCGESSAIEQKEKKEMKQNKDVQEGNEKDVIPLNEKCDETFLNEIKSCNSTNLNSDTVCDRKENTPETSLGMNDNILHFILHTEESSEDQIIPTETPNCKNLREISGDVQVQNSSNHEKNLKKDCENKAVEKSNNSKKNIESDNDVTSIEKAKNISMVSGNIKSNENKMNLNSNSLMVNSTSPRLNAMLNAKIANKTASTQVQNEQACEKLLNSLTAMSEKNSDVKNYTEANLNAKCLEENPQPCVETEKISLDSETQKNVHIEEKLLNSSTERQSCFSDLERRNSKEKRGLSPGSHQHHTPKTTKEHENELKERVSKSGSSKKQFDGADTPRRKDVTPISKIRNEKKRDSRALESDFYAMEDVTPRRREERRDHPSSGKRKCTPSSRRDQEEERDSSNLRRRELSYKTHCVTERTKRHVAFDRDRQKHLVSYRRVMASEEREIWSFRDRRDRNPHKEDQNLSHKRIKNSYTHSGRTPTNKNEPQPDLDVIDEEHLDISEGEDNNNHFEKPQKKLKLELDRHHVSVRNGGFSQLRNSTSKNKILTSSQHIVSSTSSTFKDLTATNTLFFDLLPDELKQAFQDYEQKQMIGMNMLKQTFVNYYLNQHEHSSSLFGTSKDNPKIANSSSFQNIPLVGNGQEILNSKSDDDGKYQQSTPHDQQHSDAGSVDFSVHRRVSFSSDNSENRFHQNDEPRTCVSAQTSKLLNNKEESQVKITKAIKDNIIKLYKYNQEKIPFLVKRKYGLLKNSVSQSNV